MTIASLFSASAALAAVLAAIVLIGWLARRTRFLRRHHPATDRLRVLESLSLDPRRRLLLVRCDNRCVLLMTGQQDQVVGWLPESAA